MTKSLKRQPQNKLCRTGWTIPVNKNSANFKSYVNGCLTKAAYKDKDEAIKHALSLGYDKKCKTQVYLCMYCRKYHVTHKKEKKSNSKIITDDNGNPIPSDMIKKLYNEMMADKKVGKKYAFRCQHHKRQMI